MNTPIAAVIPSYKVKKHILDVISQIPPCVTAIYVVDDRCPENTGRYVEETCKDTRVQVLYHEENKGVGGATITGYKAALANQSQIVIKLDGDGQMNPALIPLLIRPILQRRADYSKGNRFFNLEMLRAMPPIRIFGNSVLSFVSKMASGYWNLMDPTNGFTAISGTALKLLPLDKIDYRYFFESDMLFRLYTIRAVIKELPMEAVYGDEKSSLRIGKVVCSFPPKYFKRFLKRIAYSYYLRDFNPCSIQILLGLFLSLSGTAYGIYKWILGAAHQTATPLGSIMLAALPVILGFQLLLEAIRFDVSNIPHEPLVGDSDDLN